MTRLLDLLERFFAIREYNFERLDGQISQKDRQMGIDRSQHKNMIE
jgi:SNF2 family DNA or RNA helicase